MWKYNYYIKMKTTFEVVTDKYKRKFDVKVLSSFFYNIKNHKQNYHTIKIKVDDELFNFCGEWFGWIYLDPPNRRDIIIGDKKLIGCFVSGPFSNKNIHNNIIELNFDRIEYFLKIRYE